MFVLYPARMLDTKMKTSGASVTPTVNDTYRKGRDVKEQGNNEVRIMT